MTEVSYTYHICLVDINRVQVEKRDSQYQNLGQPFGSFRIQERWDEISTLVKTIQNKNGLDTTQYSRLLGEALFDSLFDDVLCKDFIDFYQDIVKAKNQILRVELDIDEREMPEIAALPWEFLCLPTRLNLGIFWMGTEPNLVFYRYRTQWHPVQPISLNNDEKVKIALIISSPPDLAPVAYKPVEESLKKLAQNREDEIELLPIVHSADPEKLDEVLSLSPHIIHFIGHGKLVRDEGNEIGQIALTDPCFNEAMWVSEDYFSELFNQHCPSVILLQACEGGMLSASQAFTGLASSLIEQNIPVVIAMQYEVTNSTASRFSRSFYQKLTQGYPVDVAAQYGRRSIALGPTQYRKRDFATPVIFMRVRNGCLFQIQKDRLSSSQSAIASRRDWTGAPELSSFFGRREELKELKNWIVNDACRLVAILGMGGIGKTKLSMKLGKGGIGKTDLSLKLANGIQDEFDYVIWRSLLNSPPLTDVLRDLIGFLSEQKEVEIPENIDSQISRFIHYLNASRCLIILDNFESVLKRESRSIEDKNIDEFLWKVATISHQSCLLITSREEPHKIARLEDKNGPVRFKRIGGLNYFDARKIFDGLGDFYGSDDEWRRLINLCDGNPLALELVSRLIKDVFLGNISAFLRDNTTFSWLNFDNFNDILNWHYERFSEYEKEVLYWLSIERQPTSLEILRDDIYSPKSKEKTPFTLHSLKAKIPIEITTNYSVNPEVVEYTLQPVLIEYITERLVQRVCKELDQNKTSTINSHALLKAQSKEYIIDTQSRLILKPILDRMIFSLSGEERLIEKINDLISLMQNSRSGKIGYFGGNIFNLLREMKADLKGYNFSNLKISQALFRGMNLQYINLANSDLSKSIFTQTFGNILAVAFSPDGKKVATGDTNNEIRILKVDDGQIISTYKEHTDWVWSLAYSPDGQILASTGDDRTLRLWDVHKDRCLHLLEGHESWIRSIVFSPDGQKLATASDDRTVKLWDVNDGHNFMTFKGHTAWVSSVDYSPDGQIIVSGSYDCSLRVWDLDTNKCIRKIDVKNRVTSVAFSPNSRMIAYGDSEGEVNIIDACSLKFLVKTEGHSERVCSLEFSPNGQTLVSSSTDKKLKLWDTYDGQCIKSWSEHQAIVWSAAFSPDGQLIVSGSENQIVKLWDTREKHCLRTWLGYTDQIVTIDFSSDGQYLVTGSSNSSIRIWSFEKNKWQKSWSAKLTKLWSVAFSSDSKLIASSSEEPSVRIWDARTGRNIKTLEGHTKLVFSLAFSPDGQKLVTASDDQTLKLWNIRDEKCIKTLEGHTSLVFSVDYSPDGQTLASGSDDNSLKIWSVEDGTCLKTLEGHKGEIWSVAFSPNTKIIASGSEDRTVKIWNVDSGKCTHTLKGHQSFIWSIAFSPNGKILASGGADHVINLWNVETGHYIRTLKGHSHWVRSVKFSPDGNILASGSHDETVRLWEPHTGECLNILRYERPYEGMNISGVKGLTYNQKNSLKDLGAIS